MRSDVLDTPILLADEELDAVAAAGHSLVEVDVEIKNNFNKNNINVISVGDVDQKQKI